MTSSLKCKPSLVMLKDIPNNEIPAHFQNENVQTNITVRTQTVRTASAPYYPSYLQGAYQLSGKNTGAGQLIAVVDAYGYPNAYADLYSFCVQFGLSKPNNVTTTTSLMSTPASGTFNFMVHKMSTNIANDAGWSIEQSLDIQWAHVSAPSAPILLVQAVSDSITDLLAAIQYAISVNASVVSLSWGAAEGSYVSSSAYSQLFSQSNVTFVASSGDAVGVNYPAVLPSVVGVGGSTLTITSTINGGSTSYARSSETVWYISNSDAEGCGISKYVKIPTYQSGLTKSSTYRSIPDVVCNANPNTGVIICNTFYSKTGSWYQVGGTSLSAPFMAGIIAAANAVRVSKNKPKFSSTTFLQGMYQLLKSGNSGAYATSIYDITVGSDDGFSAGKGDDVPSGVGAPIGDSLISYLATV